MTPGRLQRHPMTLLEILIATFILALGLMGVMSLVPVAIRQSADAIQKTHAASVAQSAKVSLMQGYLDLAREETLFKDHLDWEAGPTSVPHPALWDEEEDEWLSDDYGYFIHHNEELNEYFVLADPGEERSYAWQAEIERLDDRYLKVELSVYFPPPYRREVYRTTFLMMEP